MEIVLPEFKRLLELLNKRDVSYMLIGGYAVIYHGYERNTLDMDIWLEPSNLNRDQVLLALRDFGIGEDSLKLLSQKDFTQIQVFFIGEKPKRIDFLTRISGVKFDEAKKGAVHFFMENEKIPIINYHHLILSKISNDRPQDKADVDRLQKINQFKKKK